MAPYCIGCGAPPLMRYRGRRAAEGPLCASCIRQRILSELHRPRRAVAFRESVRRDRELLSSVDGGAVVIDLRFATPALAFAPETQLIDLDVAEGDQPSHEGSSVNGSSVNGSKVNGSSVNGSSVNGSSVNGSSVHGDGATAPRPRRTRPLRATT